nr:hypothetical protein [Halomicrobium zhouii]
MHDWLALLAVVTEAAKEVPPCRIRSIYEAYTTLCESSGTDTLAQRSFTTTSLICECWASCPPSKTGVAHEATTTVMR